MERLELPAPMVRRLRDDLSERAPTPSNVPKRHIPSPFDKRSIRKVGSERRSPIPILIGKQIGGLERRQKHLPYTVVSASNLPTRVHSDAGQQPVDEVQIQLNFDAIPDGEQVLSDRLCVTSSRSRFEFLVFYASPLLYQCIYMHLLYMLVNVVDLILPSIPFCVPLHFACLLSFAL